MWGASLVSLQPSIEKPWGAGSVRRGEQWSGCEVKSSIPLLVLTVRLTLLTGQSERCHSSWLHGCWHLPVSLSYLRKESISWGRTGRHLKDVWNIRLFLFLIMKIRLQAVSWIWCCWGKKTYDKASRKLNNFCVSICLVVFAHTGLSQSCLRTWKRRGEMLSFAVVILNARAVHFRHSLLWTAFVASKPNSPYPCIHNHISCPARHRGPWHILGSRNAAVPVIMLCTSRRCCSVQLLSFKKHFCRQSPLIQQVNLQVWDLPAPQVTTHTINVAHSKNITNCVNWYGNLKSSFIHSIAVLPFNNSMLHSCNMRSRLGCCNISFIRGLGGQRSCSSSAIQMLVFAMKKIWRRDVT